MYYTYFINLPVNMLLPLIFLLHIKTPTWTEEQNTKLRWWQCVPPSKPVSKFRARPSKPNWANLTVPTTQVLFFMPLCFYTQKMGKERKEQQINLQPPSQSKTCWGFAIQWADICHSPIAAVMKNKHTYGTSFLRPSSLLPKHQSEPFKSWLKSVKDTLRICSPRMCYAGGYLVIVDKPSEWTEVACQIDLGTWVSILDGIEDKLSSLLHSLPLALQLDTVLSIVEMLL